MSFHKLPEYLIIHLLSFLNLNDILVLQSSNKEIKNVMLKNKNIVWNLIYKNSRFPKIVVKDESFNFQFKNYTLSTNLSNLNLEEKYKLALNSHKNYLN